jgi:hypothetical protein
VTTSYRITFEGPSAIALRVATDLAAADGVDLTASSRPTALDEGTFSLEMTVEGTDGAVTSAVDRVRATLPDGASIIVATT